jgi:hypothetical protein
MYPFVMGPVREQRAGESSAQHACPQSNPVRFFEKTQCRDCDLCSTCEAKGTHDARHAFVKLTRELNPSLQFKWPIVEGPIYDGDDSAGDVDPSPEPFRAIDQAPNVRP